MTTRLENHTRSADPNNYVSDRKAAVLDKLDNLKLATKAGVSEKLIKTLREAAQQDQPGVINSLNGAKYEFNHKVIGRLDRQLAKDETKAKTDDDRADATYLRGLLRGAILMRPSPKAVGPADSHTAPEGLKRQLDDQLAEQDKLFHKVGHKIAKELNDSRGFN